ncbi:conserved hypothetical protein [Candidatus Propionivibrio aalborgensis]|uniref:Membrane-anchored protein n=1 Tax=Candidatus Propionivibrio aalborgensis TaxID=1860101 RepID=A0A1A8XLC8_9RHOO|nr:GDYXXLXY domain-containing protein [Candidatus Propionivibrio aalborgensis]SBT05974.1 conserved hypothetical protein [Candidatus Propionivibrio aalborgensis]
MKRTTGIWFGLFFVLVGAGWSIWSNERILADGRVVLLELAPIDPRSLMQGDFMSLNYALGNELRRKLAHEDGYAVVRLDTRGVATLLRVQPEPLQPLPKQSNTEPPTADEIAIRYRIRNHRPMIATNAFFFQEGDAARFADARFGEFRVGSNGEPRLTAMLDGNLKQLGENRY